MFHGHAYFMWDNGEGVSMRNTDAFVFHDVRPRVDACNVEAPPLWKVAALHGLWYVSVNKRGTLASATNKKAWEEYTPLSSWLVSLWDKHKLTHDQYEVLSATFRSGHAARMKDLDAVRRTERASAVRAHVAAELRALNALPPLAPPRHFDEVDRFVAYFKEPHRRRPILVITGATGMGKSELGRHILRDRVGPILGLRAFLEVTVGQDTALDLSNFDVGFHAGVLLDGVGDAETLAGNRESLQGRAKEDTGGRSGTMMYAYRYSLCRRAVVVTMDHAAANLEHFRSHHWLSSAENVIVLRLTASAHAGRA